MQEKKADGISVYYGPEDADSADLAADACRKTVRLLRERFALEPPADCRVYLMTSWSQFMLQAPPLIWKILLVAAFPLWVFRTRKMWPYIGGWAQRFGRRHTVGVKPPRLLAVSDQSIGRQIFLPQEDLREKVRQIACHELTHAVTDELRLPTWLKEGLPMLAVDWFAGRPTVVRDTLRTLIRPGGEDDGRGEDRIRLQRREAAVRLYTRGYWLTRYVEEVRPGLLREILQTRRSHRRTEEILAAAFRKSRAEFWRGIDREVYDHFLKGA